MTERWNVFESLAELARGETVPAIDVADRVLATLQPPARPLRGSVATTDGPLWLASALSLAVAVFVTSVATYQGVLASDPLASLFLPILPVIQ